MNADTLRPVVAVVLAVAIALAGAASVYLAAAGLPEIEATDRAMAWCESQEFAAADRGDYQQAVWWDSLDYRECEAFYNRQVPA